MADVFEFELDGHDAQPSPQRHVYQYENHSEVMEDDHMYSNVADGQISAPPPSSSYMEDPMMESIQLCASAINPPNVRVGPEDFQLLKVLGKGGYGKKTDWNLVYARRLEAPFKPEIENDEDVSLFDTRFTKMTPVDSPCETNFSLNGDNPFVGFTYVAPSVLEMMNKGHGISVAHLASSMSRNAGGFHGKSSRKPGDPETAHIQHGGQSNLFGHGSNNESHQFFGVPSGQSHQHNSNFTPFGGFNEDDAMDTSTPRASESRETTGNNGNGNRPSTVGSTASTPIPLPKRVM
ncbi:hypothetical protein L3Y34_001047 [Caenorhabditis briggsae]|uniref:AGC-kinase C-terminal domain-containing protein n=1 Tax=Caenorhabditis briggsae TaxID=6238 RepID=A0AAE9DBA4_CAEBR|nr:hypothetical protein L3Y34_001047 [Caenorhabditis briggsae]